MADQRKLTLKQRKFIKYYIESGNQSQSALKAGYKYRHSATENLSKQYVQEAYQALLERQGITDERLNDVLDDGLKAQKIVGYLNNKVNGTQKVSDEFVEVPDMPTRHKYLDTALKLKGQLQQKVEHSGEVKGGGISITVTSSELKKMKFKTDRAKSAGLLT